MQWILASASPRRKELLGELIETFEILPAKGEEVVNGDPTPAELVIALATQKAEEIAVLPQAAGKAVLGADTVVALRGNVLGKPKDEAEAFKMLSALSGQVHEVYTGVCIMYPKEGGRCALKDVACTQVRFRELSEREIEAYIATGSPMDKAGAYGIQDSGFVESINGSFSNVVGLPIELCKELFKKI